MTTNDFPAANEAAQGEQFGRVPRFYNVRLSDRDAWLAASVAALFTAIGMLLEIAIVENAPGVSAKPAGIGAFVAFLLLLVLFLRRRTPSVRWASVVYLI